MEMAEEVDPASNFILLGPQTFSTKMADAEFEVMWDSIRQWTSEHA